MNCKFLKMKLFKQIQPVRNFITSSSLEDSQTVCVCVCKTTADAYSSSGSIFPFGSFILLLLLFILLPLQTHLLLRFNLVFGHKLGQVGNVLVRL